tara:strand:+ start:196 stop:354 length:159 start_codon:yes stop_codon:yes gene_type:complete
MKKHLKRYWTIIAIGGFSGFITSHKPDYWWVYIFLVAFVVGAIDTYFTNNKK